MADKKISQLTALAAANVASATDVLAIVDTSATETKKITAKDLIDGALNGGTANGVLYLNGSKVATSGSALTFDGTNLGVGVASPSVKLDVAGAAGTGTLVKLANTTATANTNVVETNYLLNNSNSGLVAAAQIGVINPAATGNNYGEIYFKTAEGSTTLTTRMYLTAGGNLGIGTTSPAYKLDVRTASGNAYANVGRASKSTGQVAFQLGGGTSGTDWIIYQPTNSDNLTFFGNSDNRMTLDTSGNLGIATTTPTQKLEVVGGIASTGTDAFFAQRALVPSGLDVGAPPLSWRFYTTGTTYTTGAMIQGLSAGAWSSTSAPMDMRFYTVPSSSTTMVERGRFTAGGYFKASDDGGYINATASYHELRNTGNDASVVIANTNASLTTAGVTFVRAARNTTNNTFYAITYYNAGADLYRFRVADSGDCTNTNGTYAAFSDIKLKQDIVDAASQWDDIKNLRVRKYRLKSDLTGPMQLGLVAQEAETVSPGLIDEHADRDAEGNDLGTTTKSVKYSILYMKAIKALQEAMARIESLEAKVAALEAK